MAGTDESPAAPGVGVPVTPVTVGTGGAAAAGQAPQQQVVSTELRTRRRDEESEDGPEPLFLEMLPHEAVAGVSLPLPYRLAASTGYGNGISVRLAESDPARARSYLCRPFYKPISRCVEGSS